MIFQLFEPVSCACPTGRQPPQRHDLFRWANLQDSTAAE
jgi:hypothetical protein